MRLHRLRLRREPHRERAAVHRRDAGDDIRRAHEIECSRAVLFLDLLLRAARGPVVPDRRGGDEDVTAGRSCHDLGVHLLGARHVDALDAGRPRQRSGTAHQRYPGARLRRRDRDRVSHLSGAVVGEVAHRIEGLAGGAGGDEDLDSLERATAEPGRDPGRDLVRLEHPARTDLAARLIAFPGAEHRDPPLEQRQHVRPGRTRLPHLLIHRRRDHHWRRRREAQGGEEIVGEPMGEPREHVGGGRRDEHQIRPSSELDVSHPRLGLLVEQVAVHRVGGERLEGQRSHELPGRRGHHDPHLEIPVAQPSNEVGGFVGRDAARDAQHDPAVG